MRKLVDIASSHMITLARRGDRLPLGGIRIRSGGDGMNSSQNKIPATR